MDDPKYDFPSSPGLSNEVDQACANIKAHLSLPREKLLTEIINYCISLHAHKSFSKLEDILLVYLEKQQELPVLDHFIADNLIATLLLICDKKVPTRAPKAFLTFARFLVNLEKLEGNQIIMERFRYSQENVQKLAMPIYLSNRAYQDWALVLAVFLLENFVDCQVSHLTKEPEQIEWIMQAEKRTMQNRIKDLVNNQAADKNFLITVLGESNEKILRLSRQLEDIRELLGEAKIKKDFSQALPLTKNYLSDANLSIGQGFTAEEQERLHVRLREIDQRIDREVGVLKRDFINNEAYKIDKVGSTRDIRQLWHELEILKEEERIRKNTDNNTLIQIMAAKRPWNADVNIVKEDLVALRLDLESKIKIAEKKGSDKDFVSLEIREMQTEKDVKSLKEKIREIEVNLEANMILVAEAGGKNSLSNLIRESSTQAAVVDILNKEVKVIGERQEVFANILESISKDWTDAKIAQDHISEDFRRKLIKLEEDQFIYMKRHYERDNNSAIPNEALTLAEPKKGTANYPKEKPKEVSSGVEAHPSILGSRLSQLEDTYKTQMNRQLQNSLAIMQRQIIDDTKRELETRLAKQTKESIIMQQNIDEQIKSLTSNLVDIQHKIDLEHHSKQSFDKDLLEIKARVNIVETRDIYSARFESLWQVIQSLSKHLGIKVDPTNGELELLRESPDKNGSPGREKLQNMKMEPGNNQSKAEFLRDNLNLLADKLRIYREIINSMTDQSRDYDRPVKQGKELDLKNMSLEDACEQVVTLEELSNVVKELVFVQRKDSMQFRNAVDENAIAQNEFNASLANKLQDLEIAIESSQEAYNAIQDDLTSLIARESQNIEIGISKREGLRQDLDKMSTRVEELADSIKQMKDPLSVRRLQNIILNSDKPTKPRQAPGNDDSEELSERMGAMEFLMWRYARNFVEPEAQKKVSKIGRITVPVYEKLENLMFLIKNCGFIEPKTIRHAIRSFKEALSRLGRRCVQEKQDAYEEIWKLIQTTVDLDTVQYYYILEVFYALINEEKTNLDRAYESSVFEFFFEILRKQQGSQPARVCMLKILWCLSRTEAHMDFIQRSNLMPDILAICKPILDTYGRDFNSRAQTPSHTQQTQHTQQSDDKAQLFSFESTELSEIDGMFVRTALVYYSLRFIYEVFGKEPIALQTDLTYFIQTILGLLKKSMLLNTIRELCIAILHAICANSQGHYNQVLGVPEYLALLEGTAKDSNVSIEINNMAQELVSSLKGGSAPKPKSAVNTKFSSVQPHTRPLKSGGSPSQPHEHQSNQVRLPQLPQKRTVAPFQKLVTTRIFEGMPDRSVGSTPDQRYDPGGIISTEASTYYKDRREKPVMETKLRQNYVPVVTKTGLVTSVPRDESGQRRTAASRHSKNVANSVNNSYIHPKGENALISFEDYLSRSGEGSIDNGTRYKKTEGGYIKEHDASPLKARGSEAKNIRVPERKLKEQRDFLLEEGAVVSRSRIFEGK